MEDYNHQIITNDSKQFIKKLFLSEKSQCLVAVTDGLALFVVGRAVTDTAHELSAGSVVGRTIRLICFVTDDLTAFVFNGFHSEYIDGYL